MNAHLKTDPAQQAWLFEAEKKFSKEHQPNPCVRLYGPDAVGRQCKDCRLLLRVVLRSGKVFFKCRLRSDTRGPGTDHRAGWLACARFLTAPQRERKTAGHKVIHCT
jgi:hypothetical protein